MKTYDYRKNLENALVDYTVRINRCLYCGEENKIILDSQDLESWETGDFIQQAFSYLDSSKRELIQTGTHSECWDNMFESDDE